jgi:hypothetical protein
MNANMTKTRATNIVRRAVDLHEAIRQGETLAYVGGDRPSTAEWRLIALDCTHRVVDSTTAREWVATL